MVYAFENGLRKVIPYRFQYKTHAKTRWRGKTLVDVYKSEFGESPELIERDIRQNSLYVLSNYGRKNGPEPVQGWDTLRQRQIDSFDVIYNMKHMHEPSVPQERTERNTTTHIHTEHDTLLDIVFENEDILVINKPSGVPTHPTGNYFYNSVTEIVKHDLKIHQIWPCHRLDKVTSGILILAKNKDAAKYYLTVIQNEKETISKEYVTRVVGKFPRGQTMVTCPVFSVNLTGGYIKPTNADQTPINSTTVFERIAYNAQMDQSVVICKPLTGRMHQIRIHLRNIGHPIVNDYAYNPTDASLHNHSINKMTTDLEMELYHRIFKRYPQFSQNVPVDLSAVRSEQCIDVYEITEWKTDPYLIQRAQELKLLRQQVIQKLKVSNNVVCEECHRSLFDTDKDMTDLSIWLHAFHYEYPLGERPFNFKTELPKWATIENIDK